MFDILNFQQRKRWRRLKKNDWFRKTLLTISFITMGSIAYWVNPVNNLLSTILICSISSLMNSIFYLYGTDKGIQLVRQSHMDEIEQKRLNIERNILINRKNKTISQKLPKRKDIDTK